MTMSVLSTIRGGVDECAELHQRGCRDRYEGEGAEHHQMGAVAVVLVSQCH